MVWLAGAAPALAHEPALPALDFEPPAPGTYTLHRIMDDVQTQFDMMQKITGQLAENGEVKVPAEMKERPLNGKSGTHVIVKKTVSRAKPSAEQTH